MKRNKLNEEKENNITWRKIERKRNGKKINIGKKEKRKISKKKKGNQK